MKCSVCSKEMLNRTSCNERPDAIKYGEEKLWRFELPEFCRDCKVPKGGFHHPGCDMEECSEGHGQRFICGSSEQRSLNFQIQQQVAADRMDIYRRKLLKAGALQDPLDPTGFIIPISAQYACIKVMQEGA